MRGGGEERREKRRRDRPAIHRDVLCCVAYCAVCGSPPLLISLWLRCTFLFAPFFTYFFTSFALFLSFLFSHSSLGGLLRVCVVRGAGGGGHVNRRVPYPRGRRILRLVRESPLVPFIISNLIPIGIKISWKNTLKYDILHTLNAHCCMAISPLPSFIVLQRCEHEPCRGHWPGGGEFHYGGRSIPNRGTGTSIRQSRSCIFTRFTRSACRRYACALCSLSQH